MQPTVIALPVVRPGSAAAANAMTKIPVTLPKINHHVIHSINNNNNNNNHHMASSYSGSNNHPNFINLLPKVSYSPQSITFPSQTSTTSTTTTTTTPSPTSNHQMSFPGSPYSFGIPTLNPYHFVHPTPNPIQILGRRRRRRRRWKAYLLKSRVQSF